MDQMHMQDVFYNLKKNSKIIFNHVQSQQSPEFDFQNTCLNKTQFIFIECTAKNMMFYIYFQEAYDGVPAVSKLPYLVTALKNRNLSVEVLGLFR